MKNYLIAAILILNCGMRAEVSGHNFTDEMKNLHKAYQIQEQLSAEISIEVFQHKQDKEPYLRSKANIKLKDDLYLYNFEDITLLSNSKMLMMVNHIDKKIIVNSREKGSKPNFYEYIVPDFNQLTEAYDSISYIGEFEGDLHYRLHKSDGFINVIDMMINGRTHLLSFVKYEYDENIFPENNKVEIQFEYSDEKISNGIFSESTFVKYKKNKPELVDKFSDYELVVTADGANN